MQYIFCQFSPNIKTTKNGSSWVWYWIFNCYFLEQKNFLLKNVCTNMSIFVHNMTISTKLKVWINCIHETPLNTFLQLVLFVTFNIWHCYNQTLTTFLWWGILYFSLQILFPKTFLFTKKTCILISKVMILIFNQNVSKK